MEESDPLDLVGSFNPDWYSVRNYTAVRAERSLGAVRWGRTESDVIIMRDVCVLEPEKTPLKLSPFTMVKTCNWCSECFLTSRHIVRHMLLKHIQWNSKCGRCRRPMTGSIVRHECVITCTVCGQPSPSKNSLSQHLYTQHELFYCFLCEEYLPSLEEMKNHMELENRGLVASCILCKMRFPNQDRGDAMKEHLAKVHVGPEVAWNTAVFEDKVAKESDLELVSHIALSYRPNKTEKYQFDNFKCPHCQRLFSAQSGLKIHAGIAHRGGKILFCPRCPATFPSVEECKLHLKEEHGKNRKRKQEQREGETVKRTPATIPTTYTKIRSYVSTNLDVNGNGASDAVSEDAAEIMENDGSQYGQNKDDVGQTGTVTVKIEDDTVADAEPHAEPKRGQCKATDYVARSKKSKKPLPGLLKIGETVKQNLACTDSVGSVSGSSVAVQLPTVPLPPSSVTFIIQSQPPKLLFQNAGSVIPTPLPQLAIRPRPANMGGHEGGGLRTGQPETADTKKQAAYILPKPTSMGGNFNNVQLIFPNQLTDSSKVYVPAVTPSGSTILINLDEAQEHMRKGTVTFLPSGQPAISANVPTPVESNGSGLVYTTADTNPGLNMHQSRSIGSITAPSESSPATGNTTTRGSHASPRKRRPTSSVRPKIVSVTGGQDQTTSDESRGKECLNLPVVLTKRSNKKLAQDNPFFEVVFMEKLLWGKCRVCRLLLCFENSKEMENHFQEVHDQTIEIRQFPLYYEISYRASKRARTKFFLCYYCGKEFTTKFNVRRHQMLYCPRKDEINPKELGLGKNEEGEELEEEEEVEMEVEDNKQPILMLTDQDEDDAILGN